MRSNHAIWPVWPYWAAILIVALCAFGPLGALLWRAGGTGLIAPGDWAALRFTLWQAFLSACVSVLLAIPVARALARRRFWGRGALITLLGAPFLLPVLVAVLGLLAIFGRRGLLNNSLAAIGLDPISIYGLAGVVLAHVFLNLPLAVRLLLAGWQAIPEDRFRLVASLGGSVTRLLELPLLRAILPGTFLLIFLVCLTSFTVTLTLGGGPRATTLELAIYQALRFDFNPGRAATLALMQMVICTAFTWVAARIAVPQSLGADSGRIVPRWDGRGLAARSLDTSAILAAAVFLILPLSAVVLRGLPGLLDLPPGLAAALRNTLAVTLASTVLTLALSLALALRGGRLAEAAGSLPLALSGLVMASGLLLLALPFGNPARFALPATALINAISALPFALRILQPEIARISKDYGRLADMLGLIGWARLRFLLLPLARRQIGFAAGLSGALAVGDLGVIALFGSQDYQTLPLLMVGLMGAYRMEQAAGVALILTATAFLVFLICDLWGRYEPKTT